MPFFLGGLEPKSNRSTGAVFSEFWKKLSSLNELCMKLGCFGTANVTVALFAVIPGSTNGESGGSDVLPDADWRPRANGISAIEAAYGVSGRMRFTHSLQTLCL